MAEPTVTSECDLYEVQLTPNISVFVEANDYTDAIIVAKRKGYDVSNAVVRSTGVPF